MNKIKIIKIQSIQVLPKCATLLVNAYNSEPWNDSWTQEKALEKLNCFYNSPKFYGCMAFHGEELVGCCVGNIEPYFTGDYYYLKEMFVSPHSQRKGVGRALMEILKQELDLLNIKTVILFTSKDYFPFEFYLKAGFNEMEGMRMMHLGQSGE